VDRATRGGTVDEGWRGTMSGSRRRPWRRTTSPRARVAAYDISVRQGGGVRHLRAPGWRRTTSPRARVAAYDGSPTLGS